MHYMVHEIERQLDTRDKRWMFLKLNFPDDLPLIDLEGSPREVAARIVKRFIDNDSICDFESVFFKSFPTHSF